MLQSKIYNLKSLNLIIWPATILLIFLGLVYFRPWQTVRVETVTVSAHGVTKTTPDVAQITATVESTNQDINTARAQNQEKVEVIITTLKNLGIDEKNIKTQNISAGPGFDTQIEIYPPPPRPNTNQFSTSLEITVENFDIVDETIEVLTANGASNLYGPNLTLSEKSKKQAEKQAREEAVESAREKAEELAKLSGRKLGEVVNIQEQGGVGFPQPIPLRAEADFDQTVSQIAPGQNEVTINISAEFELK